MVNKGQNINSSVQFSFLILMLTVTFSQLLVNFNFSCNVCVCVLRELKFSPNFPFSPSHLMANRANPAYCNVDELARLISTLQ